MRAIQCVLVAAAALGGTAFAQDTGQAASSGSKEAGVAAIQFDLAKRKPAREESLPTAATLGDLTYATESTPEARPATKVASNPAPRPTPKVAPKPARKVAAAQPEKGPRMSEWRRTYIARHGHQPPVPPR